MSSSWMKMSRGRMSKIQKTRMKPLDEEDQDEQTGRRDEEERVRGKKKRAPKRPPSFRENLEPVQDRYDGVHRGRVNGFHEALRLQKAEVVGRAVQEAAKHLDRGNFERARVVGLIGEAETHAVVVAVALALHDVAHDCSKLQPIHCFHLCVLRGK
jgi:hypothetical protein